MTSSEADRFMLEHPEVAVQALMTNKENPWVMWDDDTRDGMAVGDTRESATANYRDTYHPEKPPHRYSPHVVERALNQSAKYHDILNLVHSFLEDQSGFMTELMDILGDDLKPTHCDKCGQKLES